MSQVSCRRSQVQEAISEAMEEGRWKRDRANHRSQSLECRNPDSRFTGFATCSLPYVRRSAPLTIYDLRFFSVPYAIHYSPTTIHCHYSTFPVVAETLFKHRRYKIVNRRVIVGYDDGMSLIDKFVH
jgi:hypothetical protein